MKTQELLYTLSFLIFVFWWIIFALKRKEDLLSFIAAGGIILLFAFIGSGLQNYIESYTLKVPVHKPFHFGFAGAMIFGSIGFIFLKIILNWGDSIYEVIAPLFFICAAVMLSVCVFEGCCFGEMTDWPLSICYKEGSPAHTWQSATGLILFITEKTYPLHPVQLYKVFVPLMIAVFYFAFRNKTKLRGSAFFSVCLVFFFVSLFALTFLEQQLNGSDKRYLLLFVALINIPFAVFKISFSAENMFSQTRYAVSLPIIFCAGATLFMFFSEWVALIPIVVIQAALVTILIAERVKQTERKLKSQQQKDTSGLTESKINISF